MFNPDVGFVDTQRGHALRDRQAASCQRPSGRRRLQLADLRLLEGAHAPPPAAHDRRARRTGRPGRGAATCCWSSRPVLCGRRLYLLKNNGALYAISRATGRVSWKRKLGYARRGLAGLQRRHDLRRAAQAHASRTSAGRIVAVRAKHRQHALVAPAAQPLGVLAADRPRPPLHRQRGRHRLLAARARRRRALDGEGRGRGEGRDRARLGQAVLRRLRRQACTRSAAPTARRSGRRRRGGGALGLGGGNFYSSAAVEYGRVYIGSTNGTVYSLSSADGKLAWSRSTGGYVYASPAVGQVRGGRPTVYIGSYDGRFYALDARTGAPALGALAGHEDLRRRDDHRRPRVRLRPRHAHDLGARRAHRQDACGRPTAARSTPRSATGGGSTSPPTRRCSRSIRAAARSTARRRERAPAAARPSARAARKRRRSGAQARARRRAASASCATASRRTATATARSSATGAAATATGTSTRCAARRSCCATTTATAHPRR